MNHHIFSRISIRPIVAQAELSREERILQKIMLMR